MNPPSVLHSVVWSFPGSTCSNFACFFLFSSHHSFLFTLYQIPLFHWGLYPTLPLYFLFASFSNTPGCNLKFDGHHSSYGRLICHYCLKIPQVFACICVVFAFPFIRYIRLWQYAGTCYTAVKGIPRRLKDPRIYFCVYMNLLLGLILSDILTYTFIPF